MTDLRSAARRAAGDPEPAAGLWAVEMNPRGFPACCFQQQAAGPVTCDGE